MQTSRVLMVGAVLVAGVLTATATERATRGEARPIVTPDVRVRGSERVVGVKVDILALARAKRPTKTVYVEEAVALWRPAYGEQIAAAGGGEAADVNAAVATTETTAPKGWQAIIADHFARNSGKYIAGLGVAILCAAAYVIYDDQKDDGQDSAPTTVNNNDNRTQPWNSPQIGSLTAGDNSPVAVNITITAMPPE